MTDIGALEKILQLAEAQHAIAQLAFQRLRAEEASLRTGLVQLDQQLRDTAAQTNTVHKALGADLLWQGWVGRSKSRLNIRLAQVLANKERHLAQVRQSYGKLVVTKKLLCDAQTEQRKNALATDLERATQGILIGRGMGDQ